VISVFKSLCREAVEREKHYIIYICREALSYMPGVAKLWLASRMRLFELSEKYVTSLFFISFAKFRNVAKWYCGS